MNEISAIQKKRLLEITVIGVVLLAAMGLRAEYLHAYIQDFPTALYPQNDARMYWEMGREVYRQGWLLDGEGPYYQAPLYPYTLALLHHAGLHDVETVIRLQLFLGVLTVLAIYGFARLLLSPITAGVASGLAGLSHFSLFFESKILATPLGTLLFVLFAMAYGLWLRKNRKILLSTAAFLYALAVICRPNLLFALPFILLHCMGPWKTTLSSQCEMHQARTRGILFSLVFVLTILPVPLRNYFVGGSAVPLTANSGVTLYMGTNPLAQGGLAPVEGLSNDIADQKHGSIDLASRLAGKSLDPAQASSFWIHRTAQWIMHHPGRFLILECKKLCWAFYSAPPAVNYSAHFEAQWIPWTNGLTGITATVLFLGLTAIPVLLIQRTREGSFLLSILAGYGLLSLVYYASDRFLSMTLPFFAVAGVYAIGCVSSLAIPRSKKRFLLTISCATALLLTENPWLSWNAQREVGMGWYNLGVFYDQQENLEQALLAYQKAQSFLPDFPALLLNLGVLHARQGDLPTSTELFRRVLELDPSNTRARENLRINQSRQNPSSNSDLRR